MQKETKESLLLLLAITIVLVALLLALPSASMRPEERAQLNPVTDGWYYIKDGEKTAVTLPTVIHYTGEDAFVLYNDSLTQDAAGMTLTVHGVQQGLKVSMGDRTLYEYSDVFFPRNDQMKAKYECDILIPSDIQVGVLKISYEKESSGNYTLSPFYIGNGNAAMLRHFTNSVIPVSLAFLFLVLSVIALGIAFYLHTAHIDKRRFVDTAIFLFICGLWVFTDTALIQIQSGNAPAVCTISFYAFMLLAVPMLYFIKHTTGMGKYRILDWLIRIFCLNALVQGILHLTLHIEFRDMLFITHLLLASGVGISVVLLVKEYRETEDRSIGMLLIGFTLLGSSGILAMALYWLLNIPFYGTIFEIGICLFVFIMIKSILMIMVENVQYRSEMQVYQRLLREDGMTGMESRQPFDDHLMDIQRNPVQYKDASLIFFKVNHLKKVNEESGHAAGDELILGAAKCISETFGEAGRCYRLQGDEFSVILEGSQIAKEEWFRRLDLAIQKFNRNNPNWLSIARGWSDFCNEDGSLKSISHWKYCANENLQLGEQA